MPNTLVNKMMDERIPSAIRARLSQSGSKKPFGALKKGRHEHAMTTCRYCNFVPERREEEEDELERPSTNDYRYLANMRYINVRHGCKRKLIASADSGMSLWVYDPEVTCQEKRKLKQALQGAARRRLARWTYYRKKLLEKKAFAPTSYTPQAIEFCEQCGILSHTAEAIKLVEQCFPLRKSLRVFLGDDPEEDGRWVVIEVTVDQDVDDFLKEYNRCVDLWVKMIPVETLSIIRLSYKLT